MRRATVTGLVLAALCAGTASAAPPDLSMLDADQIARHPEGPAAAALRAQPLYARHCAGCHGADRGGDAARGVPNLADAYWLWGDGTADSELQALVETLRVGIRSAHPKTRAVAAMPAYGPKGAADSRLPSAQIDELTEHVLALAGQPHDAAAAQRGKAVYARAGCASCHGADGSGNSDYGASDLGARQASAWVYGRSRDAVRTSITEGRAGTCPAWGGRLTETDLKALAVWLRGDAH